jgi:DMSO/TMAO reductase YedYZ molybdopterin-dependent catalytic subunit
MVFSELHWVPSAIAAVLTILLVFVKDRSKHRILGCGMAFFALIGLIGYVSEGSFNLLGLNIHTFHSWLGIAALLASLFNFAGIILYKKRWVAQHYWLGYLAAFLSFAALLTGALLLTGLLNFEPSGLSHGTVQIPAGNHTLNVTAQNILPEVEATEFQGVALTQIKDQGNSAIQGTQYIDRKTYRLQVTGLVENNLSVSYDELLTLPAYSELAYMPCVEGWGFTAKWTGFRLADLLDRAKLKPTASYVVFNSSDGYSTGLPLDYIRNNNILMAYGINDVTLPPERGFPFQLVAKQKYGYKWAKWITSIEVVDKEVAGYWESKGYTNTADVGSFPFGT